MHYSVFLQNKIKSACVSPYRFNYFNQRLSLGNKHVVRKTISAVDHNGGTKDAKKGREPKNQVHQEAILVETIRKEMANQKLFTNYSVNPFKKSEALTPKPNVYPDEGAGEDSSFIDIIHRANLEPEKKYREPQTTSQEIGWFHEPLLKSNRADPRLNFPMIRSEISAYAEEYFKFKPKKYDKSLRQPGEEPKAK
ncbi:unnamed protein product [Adineta ricciae]|uniref:Uncharacterized protein n=1 Tax=Adineta ricciae TaxID=249248 RepID=A0A814ACT6_ADIRI|nr:unnamed protein product [Adineta ricciae]